MDKESSVLGALGIHAVQNAAMKHLIKTKRFAKSVANSFNSGVSGVRERTGLLDTISGAVLPEVSLVKQEARKLGEKMSPNLKNMSKRDLVGLRMLSQGRFDDFHKHGLAHRPAIRDAISKALPKSLKPHESMLTDMLDAGAGHAQNLQKAMQSKKNPLTSNILANISKPGKTEVKEGSHGTIPRLMAGASALVPVDHYTAGMNAFKAAINSDALKKNKYLGKAVGFINDKLSVKPVADQFKRGLHGEPPRGSVVKALDNYGFNSTIASATDTAHSLGAAVRKDIIPIAEKAKLRIENKSA